MKPMKRILIKLSGEILLGEQPFGINMEAAENLAKNIKTLAEQSLEIAIVIGGGNLSEALI